MDNNFESQSIQSVDQPPATADFGSSASMVENPQIDLKLPDNTKAQEALPQLALVDGGPSNLVTGQKNAEWTQRDNLSPAAKDGAAEKGGDADGTGRARDYGSVARAVEAVVHNAGISIDNELNKVLTPDGQVHTIGPTRVMSDSRIPSSLSAADRQAFEDMIKSGDKLSKDPQFAKELAEAKKAAEADDATKEQKERYIDLAKASWATDGRELFARALSGSKDPKDRHQGVDLLREHIQAGNNPDHVRGLAVKLGADRDPKFMDAFKQAGGNVDELKREAAARRERAFRDRPPVLF